MQNSPDGLRVKILLDLSALGATANPHQRGTVGIFRVVEHTARALAAANDVEAWFCARSNRLEARRHFEQHLTSGVPDGPRARFAEPRLPGGRPVAEALTRTEDFLSRRYPHAPWRWLAAGRVLWFGARTLLERGVEPAADAGLDIYHIPAGPPPAWTHRPGLRRFVTVYDLMPLVCPEFFPPVAARHMRAVLDRITPRDWVLCISESTRRDLLDRYPRCNPDRTLVVPLAAERFFHPETDLGRLAAVRARHGIPADIPYFLSVSTLEPRKNFETVIRAYARFVRDDPARPSQLVLAGGSVRADTHPIFAALAAENEEVRRRVIFTGFVADEDLAALYSGALAFLYLSFYEGFGLPPLEAMQSGVPVIAADNSSLPEVVGDAGILLPATSEDAVAAEMRSLYLDPARRQALAVLALARAREFSWERFAEGTLAAYRRALDTDP